MRHSGSRNKDKDKDKAPQPYSTLLRTRGLAVLPRPEYRAIPRACQILFRWSEGSDDRKQEYSGGPCVRKKRVPVPLTLATATSGSLLPVGLGGQCMYVLLRSMFRDTINDPRFGLVGGYSPTTLRADN